MKNKKVVLLSLVSLIILFVVGTILYKKNEDDKRQDLATSSGESYFERAHSAKFGQNKNNVVLVEFIDPMCGSCRAFHPVTKKVFNEYEKEIKLVVRYLVNNKNSKYAVKVLEASRKQNKYLETMDVMFKYQPTWGDYKNPKPELLWDYLPEAGVDMEKLKKDFDTIYVDGLISLDKSDASALNVRGTPTLFVNGKSLKALSYKSLLDLLENEIYK